MPNKNSSQRLIVSARIIPELNDLVDYLKSNKPVPYDWTDTEYGRLNINGYEAVKVRSERGAIGSIEFEKTFGICIKKDKTLVGFSTDNRKSYINTKEDELWLDKILATFRFTK